jgi:Lipocalin-like domain
MVMHIKRRKAMNKFFKKVAGVVLIGAVLSGAALSGVAAVWAKEKADALAKQVPGSWTLVSVSVEQDGKKMEPFGSQPKGFLIFTREGRFLEILLRPNLPKFAANNRMKGTPEENQAIVQGSLAFYGTYKVVSEKEHAGIMHVEGGTFPNWEGEDQKRVWTIKGDELSVTNPTASAGGTASVIWKRAK